MKWVAAAIVVLALAVGGVAVAVAHNDHPNCVKSDSPFAPDRCR